MGATQACDCWIPRAHGHAPACRIERQRRLNTIPLMAIAAQRDPTLYAVLEMLLRENRRPRDHFVRGWRLSR